ncbi:hypothetical protein H310_07598 [Aphanomyces invadans]|uniref:Uncharacterized protein n=1 Tax=Aphanomyces invadans TaxID=157072 RepID=A0A024U194_9STRA|nr:hypothetical protein H310_07598 [Aphanomyces invadans]ETW00201.1 hypothetical protein H310_07598 [Aphanomyces invadans]|eukprot:XP_008871226.1 hypothetical protein H310_07598 [Aphanomyces invadans]
MHHDDDDRWSLPQVKKLLDSQEVNARNSLTGRAVLHEACIRGLKDVVLYLLDNADCDVEGCATPLHLAVHASNRSIVFLLLSYGANPNARDRFGSSPLHYCTKRSVAVHLIQFGGRVLAANKKRKTAAALIQSNVDAETALKVYTDEIVEAEYNARKHSHPRHHHPQR